MIYFLSYFLSGILCFLTIPIIIKFANKFGWVVYPRIDRWHKQTTALMGGIAIFISIIFNFVLFLNLKYILFIVSIILFFLLGFFDDRYELKPKLKFVFQIIISLIFILLTNTYFNLFSNNFLNITSTLLWVLLITNSCNFLDNMDGLLTGIASITTFFISIAFFNYQLYDFCIMSLIISGSCFAFLFYNKNPARIFMGDCGSLILGYTISILIVFLQMNLTLNESFLYKFSPFLFITPALLDVFLVIIRRSLSGRKIYLGGKDHISHRLVFMGFNEKQTVNIIYSISSLWSFLSILIIFNFNFLFNFLLFFLLFFTSIIFTVILSKVQVYNEIEENNVYDFLRGNASSKLKNLKYIILNKKFIFVNLIDIFIIMSILKILNVQFNFNPSINNYLIIILIKLIISNYFKVYKLSWQLISTFDIFLYVRIYLFSSISFYSLTYTNIIQFKIDLILYDFFLTINFILFTRLVYKIIINTISRLRNNREPVLIYGAGKSGYLLCNELILNQNHKFYPILFFDDDILKNNIYINNIQVYNNFLNVKNVILDNKIKVIIISSYKISDLQIKNLLSNLNIAGLIIKKFDFKIS
jgi:UDP-GlcNAc:undecaprenyl-phosphate GlcNAc-1-phosphate transferase